MPPPSNNNTVNENGVLPLTGRKIIEHEPCVRLLRYHHLGLAVSAMRVSQEFYEKLGFATSTTCSNGCRIFKSSNGMELHFLQADKTTSTETTDGVENILMDRPTEKYCGHTHACFPVPSVPACRAFLERQGMTISGERNMGGILRAVFVRDPDRTVLEFERNVGDTPEGMKDFQATMIGTIERPIDHLGTRITNPPQSWKWYAETLGFVEEVMKYQHDPDPLKNFRPWIARTLSNQNDNYDGSAVMDINLIINSNMPPNDSMKNILLANGHLSPGILYAGVEVHDLEATTTALKQAGAAVFSETEISELGLKQDKLPSIQGGSIFVADPDWNLYRLIPRQS